MNELITNFIAILFLTISVILVIWFLFEMK